MSSNPQLDNMIQQARADLSRRLGITATAITVARTESVEWRDSSLGCPQPGYMYTQVITPGYLIVLQANGQDYEYHAGLSNVVFCQK